MSTKKGALPIISVKLTAEEMDDIRSAQRQRNNLRKYLETLTDHALAAKHNVSESTIKRVLSMSEKLGVV
jgi:hypothetical protein